jgi:hypothetical protein
MLFLASMVHVSRRKGFTRSSAAMPRWVALLPSLIVLVMALVLFFRLDRGLGVLFAGYGWSIHLWQHLTGSGPGVRK